MAEGMLERGADLIAVLEALYAPEPDGEAWMRGVVTAMSGALHESALTALNFIGYEDGYTHPTALAVATSERWLDELFRGMGAVLRTMSPDSLRAFYFPSRPYATHLELEPQLSPGVVADLRAYRAAARIDDACGIFAHPEPGVAAVLCWGQGRGPCQAGPGESRIYTALASHLDSALRLRTRPEQAVAAVIAPDGALLDLSESALEAQRSLLGARVTRVERTRLRARRTERSATDEWEALVDGCYTLVPREDTDGRRYYFLVHNPPAVRDSAALEPNEENVLRLAARGFTGKASAYALGVSQATVSDALRRAARKLGLRSRVELVTVAAALFGPGRGDDAPDLGKLSQAEREVLALLRRGLSNAEIARVRDRSVRTIANQVASLLAKTGAGTRRTLAARSTGE